MAMQENRSGFASGRDPGGGWKELPAWESTLKI